MGEGIGRVFFLKDEVGFQPLSNHQGLVVKLLESWREGDEPLALSPKTKERLLLAARYHDDGKRFTFHIVPDGKGGLTYSFRGHRFRVAQAVQDPYAQALIRGHHDYSTREVVNLAADFLEEGLGHRFPEDLFLLMMADQLEAELAVRLWQRRAGEVRPFVEFDLLPDGEGGFLLDPWPFRVDEVALDFLVYFHPYRGEEAKVDPDRFPFLVAAPELSLTLKTWCFPVAGCVGYKGYFDRSAADAEAAQLRAQGLEVSVHPVPAYSTLGWSNWAGGDPLLNTFIHYPEGALARLVFHELAHQVLYVPDDTAFNESFATAVERLGVQRWLALLRLCTRSLINTFQDQLQIYLFASIAQRLLPTHLPSSIFTVVAGF